LRLGGALAPSITRGPLAQDVFAALSLGGGSDWRGGIRRGYRRASRHE
jgi:hypothetical protein